MKLKLIAFFILIHSFLFSQEIAFNKDSLYFIPNEQNYGKADTLWMYNNGNEELIVDSIFSVNNFGYKLESLQGDSLTVYHYIYNDSVYLSLPPLDSMMLIISDPDRCPVCKFNPASTIYNDTIFFISNSKTNHKYAIFTFIDEYVTIDDDRISPSNIELFQNHPNPFNPTTMIEFNLPKPEYVTLEIYNSLGQKIACLINKVKLVGKYQVTFNGSEFPSGQYIYNLTIGNYSESKKMLLLK